MRIVYVALRPLVVGEDTRVAGDLVPEAHEWNFLPGYVAEGKLFPVLVATLPEETQVMLMDWEAEQEAVKNPKADAKPAAKQKVSA